MTRSFFYVDFSTARRYNGINQIRQFETLLS